MSRLPCFVRVGVNDLNLSNVTRVLEQPDGSLCAILTDGSTLTARHPDHTAELRRAIERLRVPESASSPTRDDLAEAIEEILTEALYDTLVVGSPDDAEADDGQPTDAEVAAGVLELRAEHALKRFGGRWQRIDSRDPAVTREQLLSPHGDTEGFTHAYPATEGLDPSVMWSAWNPITRNWRNGSASTLAAARLATLKAIEAGATPAPGPTTPSRPSHVDPIPTAGVVSTVADECFAAASCIATEGEADR